MNYTFFAVIGIGFMILELAVFALVIIRSQKKYQRKKEEKLQEVYDSGTKALDSFVNDSVVKAVEESYSVMISKDLVPAVVGLTATVNNFTDNVAKQQQDGLEIISVKLTDLFSKKLQESMKDQFDAINQLAMTTKIYQENISEIVGSTNKIVDAFEDVSNKAQNAATDLNSGISHLGVCVGNVQNSLDAAADCIKSLCDGTGASEESMERIVNVAHDIEQTAADFASKITNQNAETVLMLENVVRSLTDSAEASAKETYANLKGLLNETNEKFSITTSALNDVSDDIHKSATEFALAIANTYVNFASSMESSVMTLYSNVAESAENEYQRIIAASGENSSRFEENVEKLRLTFADYISNIESISNNIRESAESFEGSAQQTSNLFTQNIEDTINSIFKQFDKSLAQISKYLVESAGHIKDAADSLPIAVSAIKNEKK